MKIRSIVALALSVILTLGMAGCFSDNMTAHEKQPEDEERLPTTHCVIDITGDYEQYREEDKDPYFGFLHKKAGEEEWKIYSVFECDGEEKDIELIEGRFLIYSDDIGEKEIYVDDTDDVYSITLDYSAGTIDFHKTADN